MLFDIDHSDGDRSSSEASPLVLPPQEIIQSSAVREFVSEVLVPNENKDSKVQEILKYLDIGRIEKLLVEGTHMSALEVLSILGKINWLAFQRWDRVHALESHRFSDPSLNRVNGLGIKAGNFLLFHPGAKVLELGCGLGQDAIFMAEKGADVLAFDVSATAISRARELAEQKLGENVHRVRFREANFTDILDNPKSPHAYKMVYTHSTAHYWPVPIFSNYFLPRTIRLLQRRGSRLFIAMKSSQSASAQPNKGQIHLDVPNSAFLHAIDTRDGLMRIYPNSADALVDIMERYFRIHSCEKVDVKGYDKDGEVENFIYITAAPKSITRT